MNYRMEGRSFWTAIAPAVILTLILGPVLQARPDRAFSVTISPVTAAVGETKPYTITITNEGSGGGASANLGSATIQVPAGFTVVVPPALSVTTSPTKSWTAALNVAGTEILLCGDQGNDTFSGGDYVAVTFTATAPSTPGTCEWTTTLRKNTNWHGPTPALVGTQPVVTVQDDVTPPDPEGPASVCGAKFYDTDTDGVWEEGEPGIEGWKIHLVGDTINTYVFTDSDGEFCFPDLEAGSYVASEVFPLMPPTWVPTTETSFSTTVDDCEIDVGDFGNVCLGAGGGHTLGYWSNKNGHASMTTYGLSSALSALTDLNLVNGSGAPFVAANYAAFRTWLLSATATNMAYMLSTQLAAMKLNVLVEFVDGDALVYAPGVPGTNPAGFISVNALITAANTSLGADGYTPADDPNRSVQESIKNALDQANNNQNFVSPAPCLPIVY
ncbi:MAG: hypothetical protein EHM35_16325, partial [Planctomycetaceae bacterium]